MNKNFFYLPAVVAVMFLFAGISRPTDKNTRVGSPEIMSISAMTFGTDGVLFLGDSKSATVFAVNTKDTKRNKASGYNIKNIDQKIAAALGTVPANIMITDMAVNPVSKKLYIAVHHSDGTPVLLTVEGNELKSFSLKDISYSMITLNNAPAADAKDQRGRPLRVYSISDLGFADGKLMVSGLSNKQFSSSFKSIRYPFTDKQDESSLEIYHASHGRYETTSPIRTFTTTNINGRKYLVASYTCTPLVLFPLDELKPGSHVKGRTVAEMGSGNSPIDMITVKSGSADYLMLANTTYPIAKVDYKNISAFEGTLTQPVSGTAGVAFKSTNTSNVSQMDKLEDDQLVLIQKKANGDVDLWTANETNL